MRKTIGLLFALFILLTVIGFAIYISPESTMTFLSAFALAFVVVIVLAIAMLKANFL